MSFEFPNMLTLVLDEFLVPVVCAFCLLPVLFPMRRKKPCEFFMESCFNNACHKRNSIKIIPALPAALLNFPFFATDIETKTTSIHTLPYVDLTTEFSFESVVSTIVPVFNEHDFSLKLDNTEIKFFCHFGLPNRTQTILIFMDT